MAKKIKPIREADIDIRCATVEDIQGIRNLTLRAYPELPSYKEGHIRGHINAFKEGNFVVCFRKKIIGYCASFLVKEDYAFKPHSWFEITGGGYNAKHDSKGDWLYGMEVCVDPDFRGMRVGRRLYEKRKQLVQDLELKGIVIVGRVPGYHKVADKYKTATAYAKAVKDNKERDSVIGFQLRNGFQIKKVFKDYLTTDKESLGNAILMVWKNPHRSPVVAGGSVQAPHQKDVVRVSTVQYMQRRVSSFSEFIKIVEYFVDIASDYRSDFVVFPEWFTLQLLSMEKKVLKPHQGILRLCDHHMRLRNALGKLSVKYNINIIGGSTARVSETKDVLENVSYIYLRDGSIYEQVKLHPTPNERFWWNIRGGNQLQAIETDCGTIGVLICYDSEFPELVRHLVDQGIKILFVPFCTDERQSYLRVRYCAQARAVENQIYVCLSGNVGNLPRVENMDIQYAQSCILTPCDFPFARDGIAADTTPDVETVAVADLRIDELMQARNSGTVQNLKDRRHDLYHLTWKEKF